MIPWLLTRPQATYLNALGTRLRRVLNRVLRAYAEDPVIQTVLPLSDDERSWMSQLAPKGIPEPATVFERLDTNLDVDDPHWPKTLRFLEFNSVGVGCVDFTPVANELIAEHVLPTAQPIFGSATCRMTVDPRALLHQMFQAHAKAIGRTQCVVALVERRETPVGGADEMAHVSEWLKAQGMHSLVADPRELEVRNGELVYKDVTIDLVYRDFALSEIISIEKHGGQVEAMKHAFRHNQVISAITGEFDHKSVCEFLASPEFERYFTPSQRRTFQAFMPWTRLVRERKTTDADRHEIDLSDYLRTHREGLVLKPNRAYGGQDVVIGVDVTAAVWDQAIWRALAESNQWVVQEFVPLPKAEFLDLRNGKSTTQEFVTVGFIATPGGIAFVGRASRERVVNISRGGSLVPMFLMT